MAAEAKAEELANRIEDLERELASANERATGLEGELANVIKDKASLQDSAEKLKEALAELAKRKAAADKRVAEFKKLIGKFKALIDAGKLKVRIVDGRMVLALPTDILFASGSADLSDEGKAAIFEVSAVLATMPDRRFQVEGHTDNVPIKRTNYKNNWELASARALGVVEAMIEAGMNGDVLSAASYGEFRPVVKNNSPENKAANRRIEIVLVPDLSTLPGFEDLKKAVGEQ